MTDRPTIEELETILVEKPESIEILPDGSIKTIKSEPPEHLLEEARQEILRLRRANEILSAKVEMIDLFACVLHTSPARHSVGESEDVAWKLQQKITELSKRDPTAAE